MNPSLIRMANTSKQKGNRFERELVNFFKANELFAERAYASNGKALGCCEETDLIVEGHGNKGRQRIQAKIRKTLPAYLQIPDDVDAVCFRQDRGDTLVLISIEQYMEFLKWKEQ